MEMAAELADTMVGALGCAGTAAAMKVDEALYELKPRELMALMAKRQFEPATSDWPTKLVLAQNTVLPTVVITVVG